MKRLWQTIAMLSVLSLLFVAAPVRAQDDNDDEEVTPTTTTGAGANLDSQTTQVANSGPSVISPDTGTPQDPVQPQTNPQPTTPKQPDQQPDQQPPDEEPVPPGTYCENTGIWGTVCFPDDPLNDLRDF